MSTALSGRGHAEPDAVSGGMWKVEVGSRVSSDRLPGFCGVGTDSSSRYFPVCFILSAKTRVGRIPTL